MKNLALSLFQIGGGDPIFAGRLAGKRVFMAALDQLPSFTESTLVLLDFHGIDVATSSFLSEVLLPLRDLLRLRQPPGYVVAANLSERVREEAEEMLRRSGDAILICARDANGQMGDLQLCGRLESKLQETLHLVSRSGETTAAQLHSEFPEQAIGATAWNNRLSSLAAKSLIVEVVQGRTKKYRPLLEIA
jgi:hypothetical protein